MFYLSVWTGLWLTHSPDVSIEQVAALAAHNALPEPIVNLDKLPPPVSTFTTPVRMPTYSEDPWSTTNPRYPSTLGNTSAAYEPVARQPVGMNGVPSSLSGSGLPKDWWKKQETVKVNFLGHQGFILNRYMVYEISTDVRCLSLTHLICDLTIPAYREVHL